MFIQESDEFLFGSDSLRSMLIMSITAEEIRNYDYEKHMKESKYENR